MVGAGGAAGAARAAARAGGAPAGRLRRGRRHPRSPSRRRRCSPPPRPPALADAPHAAWQRFDRAQLAALLHDRRVVLVDVTADWCLTCKVNESLVLGRGAVAAALAEGRIAGLRADWTRPDPSISEYLASFGRYGIPFNAGLRSGRADGHRAARAPDPRGGPRRGCAGRRAGDQAGGAGALVLGPFPSPGGPV
ncbi:MAG: thioredoxin family protein [Pseudomonadota bacterium]